MAYYNGPYSTSFETTIPRGTVLQVYSEAGEWGLMTCTIRDRAAQGGVVPPEGLHDTKYSACAFMFGLHEIGPTVEILS